MDCKCTLKINQMLGVIIQLQCSEVGDGLGKTVECNEISVF